MIDKLIGFARSLRDYNRSFWAANLSELFERIAFYGLSPMLVVYLTEARGFESSTAIFIGGNFGLVTYGLASVSGFVADWLGYRRAMLFAYALLTLGYTLVGQATSFAAIVGSLLLVAIGASLIKPVVTGTVQKTCREDRRSVGFSIYYMLVNIGGFLGPNLSAAVRERYGVQAVLSISALAAAVALGVAALLYREPTPNAEASNEKRSLRQFAGDFVKVIGDPRLLLLFAFVAGWWSMFFQFMNVLPIYLRDDLHAAPYLLGLPSLGAGSIMVLQVPVGYLVRNVPAFRAVLLAFVISTVGVAAMSVYPSVALAAVGVVGFSLGEMIYSAHFYHYLGNVAPPGQVGMYMGFAFLPIALGSFLSGLIGGPIVGYFRDTQHAPQLMWLAFATVGAVSAIGLYMLTRRAPEPEQ